MATVFQCGTPARRDRILNPPSGAVLNAIDYLEVIDEVPIAGMPRQRTLLLHLFRTAPTTLAPSNVRITGGVRVTAIGVSWIQRADAVAAPGVSAAEAAFYAGLAGATSILVVRTDVEGDFATYRLRLVAGASGDDPPAGFDVVLSEVAFSFKVECPSDFDCAGSTPCPAVAVDEPAIDYLAKDYQSFRRVLLDRLAVVMPQWRETSPADPLMTVIEALAYVGDHLSYQQDAIATEAYLGTARRRISVRRHARLLDYRVHDGASARAWLHVEVTTNVPITAFGARFSVATTPAVVYEPLHAITLQTAHNQVRLYTWGDDDCCLPRGATRATFAIDAGDPLALVAGDVVMFEEAKGPATGVVADADPARRHPVRLTRATPRTDPFTAAPVLDVEWDIDDALPFPLCVSATIADVVVRDITVVRGNMVLVEHGESTSETLPALAVFAAGRYRPRLSRPQLSHRVDYVDATARTRPARAATQIDPRAAMPAIGLTGAGDSWTVRSDLLASSPAAHDFVAEIDDAGIAQLRFGDGRFGAPPLGGLTAQYRVGGSAAGNVGRDTITSWVVPGLSPASAIAAVRNPLPATGGCDPEPVDDVKLYAPHAFRRNERAVTEDDYARRAETYPDVQRAVAVRRWTGSWYTMVVVVDRRGGRLLDDKFRTGLRAHLERYRLAGFDLELADPVFVALDLALAICVRPEYFRSDVRRGLVEAFSAGDLPDGRRGFFHPDNFTFGEPVRLSQIVATAMRVPGVEWVNTHDPRVRFQRLGVAAAGELLRQQIALGPLEIARLDNSPSLPENGRLRFELDGGR